jgi:NitT/TauT family transport system substrate-binding protein
MAIPSTNVTYLPLIAAQRNGYYKEEGFEVEFILMRANLASTAVLTGDIDYNGAVTGIVGAAITGQPLKAVIFTMRSPVQSLMARKDIKDPRQLKGKKIGVSSPGSTTDLVARHIFKHFGLEIGRDLSVVYVGGEAPRLIALESGVLDASMLSVPENIMARQRGFNELAFAADYIEFPQNGFGTAMKKLKENRDEVYRMVRATVRGLTFASDKKNKEAALDMIMKSWNVKSRGIAEEMYQYMARALLPDASISMEGLQFLVDRQRETAKITEPINAAQVIDYSFVEKARKELGLAR